MKKQLNEIKRMQQLAGVIKESQQLNEDIHDDIDQDLMNGDLDQEEQIEYLRDIINYCQSKINEIEGNLNESQLDEVKPVSKEDKIAVINEWIQYTCDEGQAKDDINKYNKMVDTYFADKNDVTEDDFKKIWAKVTEKWGVGDTGADWDAFPETWADVQTGTLTGTY